MIADISVTVAMALLSPIETSVIEIAMQEAGVADEAFSAETGEVVSAFAWMILAAFFAALIASWVGLLTIRPWSRWLYLGIACSTYLPAIPLSVFDVSYSWGLPYSIGDIEGVITGAILAVAFLSPIARESTDVQAIVPPSRTT